ncbi:MAG TPA: aldehyde dehydrogenase family protein [Bacteroidetes bacterium]|nr:aldehyde dehydrogenase family protein [Bacteroidota bacterium]
MTTIQSVFENQQNYFRSGQTLDLNFRVQQLKKLRSVVSSYNVQICEAMFQDMAKPEPESQLTEIITVLHEIDHHIKNLKKWAKPKKARGSLLTIPSSSRIYQQPYGVTLIISAWNYPFYLMIMPLIGAISAGNTAILKPSEMAPHTSTLIKKMLDESFDSGFISTIEGGVEITSHLLELPFNKIFFTGSTYVGRIVMSQAAKHLTPVTLELGGKSPAIIHRDSNMEVATKRIWWGKCVNAGQTCVAPDYVLVHESIKDEFIAKSRSILNEFYPNGYKVGENYTKIINQKHFDRIIELTKGCNIVLSGTVDRDLLLIEPMLITDVKWDHPIMNEEIFGPILPVLTYRDETDLLNQLSYQPNPLALYLFTKSESLEQNVIQNISFGGGCINDTMSHLGNSNLPFGGIGKSGIGNYHGESSFNVFSHSKSMLKRSFWPDPSLRYPPLGNKIEWIKKLFK